MTTTFTPHELALIKTIVPDLDSLNANDGGASVAEASRFVEIDAHRKLSYTWSVPFLETVVTFTLTPTTTGTRLSLLQSGFGPDQKQESGGARYGWKRMGGKLVELLAKVP